MERSTRDGTGTTVAVARDAAFRFVYPAVLERFRDRGTVRPFSPLASDPVPEADAVYLPGGYPEKHAERLERSESLDSLADLAADGRPILAECGGMMALAESLTVGDTRHQMAGVLPATVSMTDRLQALDHVRVEAIHSSPLGRVGTVYRGHEFHYSRAGVDPDARFVFEVDPGTGLDGDRDGLLEYNTVGTYAHFHAASGIFDALLERA